MSNNFSLLSLNDNYWDKHPRSWICISGENIKEIVSKIEKEIIEKRKTNREQISKLIAGNLNCNYVSIKNFLRGDITFYTLHCSIRSLKEYQNTGFDLS